MSDRGRAMALWHRPMLENEYLPLLALLCDEGYHERAMRRIVNHIKAGGLLVEAVDSGDLERADLVRAEEALMEGASWAQSVRARRLVEAS